MGVIKLDIISNGKAYWSKKANKWKHYIILKNNSDFEIPIGQRFRITKTQEAGSAVMRSIMFCDFATVTQESPSYFLINVFTLTRIIKIGEVIVIGQEYDRSQSDSFTVIFSPPRQHDFIIGGHTFQAASNYNMVSADPLLDKFYSFKEIVIYKDKFEHSRHIVKMGIQNRLKSAIRFEPSSIYEFDLQDSDIDQATYELEEFLQSPENIVYENESI